MERVQQGLSTTVSFTFEVAGIATDPAPDSATVRILRTDGTVLTNTTAATNAGTGVFTYTLSPTETALLDTLRLEWTATISGFAQTLPSFVEVAGGFYFTISEAQALPELATKTPEEIVHVRTLAEQSFEDAAGVAFVPRYHRTTLAAIPGYDLPLPKYPVRALRDVSEITSIGGSPSSIDPSGLAVTRAGIFRSTGWTAGPSNVTIGYEYGYDRPPERVARAVLLLAKNWLVDGPIDDRATGIPAGEAGGVITLATPGQGSTIFGIPEVDATLKQYGRKQPGLQSIPLTPASNSYYRNPDFAWHGGWW